MNLWSLELQNWIQGRRSDYSEDGGKLGVLCCCGVFRNGLRTTASKQIMILMEEENCVVKTTTSIIDEPDIESINKQGGIFHLLPCEQGRKNAKKHKCN